MNRSERGLLTSTIAYTMQFITFHSRARMYIRTTRPPYCYDRVFACLLIMNRSQARLIQNSQASRLCETIHINVSLPVARPILGNGDFAYVLESFSYTYEIHHNTPSLPTSFTLFLTTVPLLTQVHGSQEHSKESRPQGSPRGLVPRPCQAR